MSLVEDWVKADIEQFNANEPDPKKYRRIGFDTEKEKGKWEKSGVGAFIHAAVINVDNEKNLTSYAYDIVEFRDGPIDKRTGLSTPGTVIAPVEKVGDEYYVRCFWEYRPVIWDNNKTVPDEITDPVKLEEYMAINAGEWVLTTPGGYAKLVKESAESTAKAEGNEESGLNIQKPIFTDKNFNRSNIQTKAHVGYSTFTVGEGQNLGRDERTMGSLAVNLRVFETPDAMVQTAVDFAARELILKKQK